FRRVGSLHEHERLAAFEEAAEGHAAGAAHLDEGELRHVVVDHGTLDEGDLARAVEDHGDHLPRLDELGEAPRLVARPDPTRPVGVLLDGVLELRRLLEAIEDVGGLPVWRGPAADQDARGAQPLQPLDVASPVALATGKRIAYTTPLKALSNQKFNDFTRVLGAETVGILTGDVKVNPHGRVLVMTTEILRNALYGSGLEDLGYIVLDECHYMGDE